MLLVDLCGLYILIKMEYKFKIGDKVKIRKGGSGCHPDEIGKIVTIESLGRYYNNLGYRIVEKELKTNSSGNHYIGENSFELAEEYVCPFKVGDQVVLTKTEKIPEESYNWTIHLNTNTVYTVSRISGKWIRLKEDEKKLSYHPKKFKLANNKKSNIDEKALNLKVGDKIKILTRPSKWSSLCNSNGPLHANITYPYVCTIKEIKKGDNYIGFTCGDYGWSISKDSDFKFELINDCDSDCGYKLPNKWCVKVTDESREELLKYLRSRPDLNPSYNRKVKCWVLSDRYNDGSYQCWSGSTPSEYTEISFENFKKYVKYDKSKIEEEDNNQDIKFSEGDIVVCLPQPNPNLNYTVGIDPVKEKVKSKDYLLIQPVRSKRKNKVKKRNKINLIIN